MSDFRVPRPVARPARVEPAIGLPSTACVVRVLRELGALEDQLLEEEHEARQRLQSVEWAQEPWSDARGITRGEAEKFELGQIEGLIIAQLALQKRRAAYRTRNGVRSYPGPPAGSTQAPGPADGL